jgi:hypothetical protein
MQEERKIEIRESYKGYSPPLNVMGIIQKLVDFVPDKLLVGISHVVITNTGALSHDRRRMKIWIRGKKYSIMESFAVYYPKSREERAYIEIFVDNIIKYYSSLWLKVPCYRAIVFADVLYHEIGHHLQDTVYPEYRDGEDAAEEWMDELLSLFIKKNYWYLYPFLYLWDQLKVARAWLRRTR